MKKKEKKASSAPQGKGTAVATPAKPGQVDMSKKSPFPAKKK